MKLDLIATRTDRVLIDAFGADVFVIGGPVRDKLRSLFHGIPYAPKDHDYVVVGHTLAEVRERLGRMGRLDAVGASFGVLKLTLPDEPTVDVALPRRERSTGPGHRDFEVESGPMIGIEEDQARRDFLMNAVAVRLLTGEVIAHPGALDDIRDKRISVINGRQSFLDDPLRMLRAAQFAARFAFEIAPETRTLMREGAGLIRSVAPERISEELNKMFTRSARPSDGVRILHDTDLLPLVIPGLERGAGVEQNRYHAYDVLEHGLATLDASRASLESRWAAILHDIGKPATRSPHKSGSGYTFYNHEHVGAEMAQQILRGLRFPNSFTATVTRLVANHMYVADPDMAEPAIKRFINRVGPDLLEAQFELRRADKIGSGIERDDSLARNARFEARVHDIMARQPPLGLKDLAVDGRDVITALVESGLKPAGYRQGREIGHVLGLLREQVIERPELNTRDALAAAIHAIIAEMKRSAV
jgi:putative nucleotidyltransferase with HDIG domain